ncbi:hypothetical protein Pla110_31420 [Polystyrenella longa]|uniref:Uncharacterized protein n=1 Tax=Polystyrenella longa TaxID=2528007 RepID=A0A518CQA8_9PLAN|nr:hypothetical protein Pla110_31420 [Polystyrenella longa]
MSPISTSSRLNLTLETPRHYTIIAGGIDDSEISGKNHPESSLINHLKEGDAVSTSTRNSSAITQS